MSTYSDLWTARKKIKKFFQTTNLTLADVLIVLKELQEEIEQDSQNTKMASIGTAILEKEYQSIEVTESVSIKDEIENYLKTEMGRKRIQQIARTS